MSIASELQDKINSKAAIKAAIEAKGVTVGDVKLNQYASKIDEIEQGGGDPSIPVGTGQHLVTFYDFDGKVLKRQRVNTGEDATAPEIPTHQYLTFAEWNNPFTNVQSDIDTGAIYNTTNGKTYLFITLTPVTGLAPTLFFSKSSASLMTIDWGDGTTSTSTTSGDQTATHIYATAGDYIITVDNSAGGTYRLGQYNAASSLFSNGSYSYACTKIYLGTYMTAYSMLQIQRSLKHITSGIDLTGACQNVYSLTFLNFKNTTIPDYGFSSAYNLEVSTLINVTYVGINAFNSNTKLNKLIFGSGLRTIRETAFLNCFNVLYYIFLSTTPPTLANVNAFTGINPICKIYVPDASVAAYKAATNWNNYANYIYPLSQKPQSDE